MILFIETKVQRKEADMYQRLKDQYALRGWKGLPYGIMDTQNGATMFLDGIGFQAASFCDGMTDLDSPLVLPTHREAIEKLRQFGVIEECLAGQELDPFQKHRKSESHFVSSLHWSITGKCNMNCRHCFLSAPEAKYGELATEECLSIIDQIADANIGKVSLTGGEPLVREDFWQLVDALLAKRIVIHQIYSNGLLLTDEFLQELSSRQMNPTIFLSLDCTGGHDWMRGIEGAEKAVMRAIERTHEHGFSMAIETALHKGNLPQLMATYHLLKSLGVHSWKVSATVGVGNWAQEKGQYDLSQKEFFDPYLELIEQYQRDGAPLTIQLGGFYFCEKGSNQYKVPILKFDGSERMLKQPVCRSARLNPYVMADGTLLPCIPMTGTFLEDEMPTLRKTPISAAMEDSRFFELIDMRLETLLQHNKECDSCEYKLQCGMGCRAQAMLATGDYYGIDPESCFFYQNKYKEKIEKIHLHQEPL